MAELEKTPNLGIPRILGNQPLVRQQFNGAIDELDKQALSVNHANTKAHFELWKANTTYKIQDIVRTSTCPSWGFYMCTTPGTSGTNEPQGYGEGDEITDGTCVWKLKLFGGPTSMNHGDLKFRNQPDQHSIEATTGLIDALDGKVDKVEGKGLSSNDYVDVDKAKVDKISEIDGKFAYDGKTIVGGASDWETGKIYSKDELVVCDNKLYRCLANHTSTDFISDENYWQEILGEGEVFIEDTKTVALLHFNETSLKDMCGNIWTVIGQPGIGTNIAKFGAGGLYLGRNSYLRTNLSDSLDISSGDFTIDWWETTQGSHEDHTVISYCDNASKATLKVGTSPYGGGKVMCYASSDGTSWDILNGFSLGTRDDGHWVHRALVRKGENFYGFQNGVLISTTKSSAKINFNATAFLQLGSDVDYASYIDEFRITKMAQWTKSFTPSTQEYKLISDTAKITNWAMNTLYRKNQVVVYDKKLYKCLNEHTTTESFDSTKWENIGGSSDGSGINYLGGFSQDVIFDGSMTVVGNYTLTDTLSNYDLIMILAREKLEAGNGTTTLVITVDDFKRGFGCRMVGYSNRYTDLKYVSDTAINVSSISGDAKLIVEKIIGIKGKINNAGEPSRLIQDKLFSGNANAIGSYTLSKNINSYDYLMVVTAWSGDITKRRNTQIIYKGDYANTNQYWEIGTIVNETRSLHYRVNDSTLTIISKDGGTNSPTIVEIIGVKYKEGSSAIAPDWVTGKDYLQNQLIVNLGILYRCLSDHTSTDFVSDKSYWEKLSGGGSSGNGGGDIEKVLWEGTAGSKDATIVNSLINLSESVEKYDLIAIEFVAYSLANSAVRRPQRREFSVSQLKDLINTPSSINYGLQSVWGYANYDDFVEISNLNGKTTLLSLDLKCKQAQITKVIGIKNSSLQIKDWESDKSYVQNQVVLNNDVMYRCIESHLSAESFDSTKWQELNRGTGIEDISYSLTNNTLTVKLTDGTAQSFSGLGINYFGGFNQTTLWKGDQAIPDSTMTTITLSDIFTNYDFIIVKCALGFAATAVVPVVDSGIGGGLSLYATSGANAFCAFSSGVSTNKKTLGFNTGKYVGWGQPRVLEVIGIKGSTTEKVLWEGNLGTTGLTNITGNITLTESLKNYSKVAFIINTYYSSSGNTYITPKKEELYVSELEPMISDTWNRATACWGFSTVTNCFYIKPTNAEMTEMWWAASQTKIIRIIGIK